MVGALKKAAEPYAGTTVDVVFLLRPGYEAIEAMLPAFEEETGIKINIIKHPYENALGEQVRDFVAGGDLDIALIDLVWIGNFAENDWIVPIDTCAPRTFPETGRSRAGHRRLLPAGAGRVWQLERRTTYGLPFDNYSGLLFYNKLHVGRGWV